MQFKCENKNQARFKNTLHNQWNVLANAFVQVNRGQLSMESLSSAKLAAQFRAEWKEAYDGWVRIKALNANLHQLSQMSEVGAGAAVKREKCEQIANEFKYEIKHVP